MEMAVFFLIIYLLKRGNHVQIKKTQNTPINSIQHSEKEHLFNYCTADPQTHVLHRGDHVTHSKKKN